MRVHPSQLSQGLFPFFGPSHLWVKSFNLNNKKIVFSICVLFLFSVIGSALNKETLGDIKNKISLLYSTHSVGDPLAIVLSNANKKIFLLSAPSKQVEGLEASDLSLTDLELTMTEKVFLEESRKFGTLSVSALSDAAEYPLLKFRSVKELKELLAPPAAAIPPIESIPVEEVSPPAPASLPVTVNPPEVVELPVQASLPVAANPPEVVELPVQASLPVAVNPPEVVELPVQASLPVAVSPPEVVELPVQASPPITYEVTSRIFVRGESEIYGITRDGKVVEISSNGNIIESVGN